MQTTEPLTIGDIANHAYWLDSMADMEREESAELTERFIDTFGEQDDEKSNRTTNKD